MTDLVVGAEDVACVGVLGHEAQGLALATAADKDVRVRSTEHCRRVERASQSIMAPLESTLILAPHLQADLQCLLETLKALAERREGETQP